MVQTKEKLKCYKCTTNVTTNVRHYYTRDRERDKDRYRVKNKTLHCNRNVQKCNTNVQICNTEIEKEIDIEIELENIASHCDTNVQKSDTEIELEKDIEIEKRVRKVWRYR